MRSEGVGDDDDAGQRGVNSQNKWSRADRLQLIAIIVSIAAIVVVAVVSLTVPEIRCAIGLESSCAEDLDESAEDDTWTGVPTILMENTEDRRRPYPVDSPAPVTPEGRSPTVELSPQSVVNRGAPVTVQLSGAGFASNSSTDITWFRPDGRVYRQASATADERGLLSYGLLWIPDRVLGTAGTEGTWKIEVRDRYSGFTAPALLPISNDTSTPPADTWPTGKEAIAPFKAAAVNAGTSGRLCDDNGAFSTVTLEGFTSYSLVEVAFVAPDGHEVLRLGVRTDGVGSLHNLLTYWKIDACDVQGDFLYSVIATQQASDLRSVGEIILTSLESDFAVSLTVAGSHTDTSTAEPYGRQWPSGVPGHVVTLPPLIRSEKLARTSGCPIES